MLSTDFIVDLITSILALIIAIVGHEVMHARMADYHGDASARREGRLSLNPLVHIDPIGTILVPFATYFIPQLLGGNGFLFGWAKPVPVNMRTVIQNGGYNAAIQVSLAGIVYNLTVAILASVVLTGLTQPSPVSELPQLFLYHLVLQILVINTVLSVLNLLPIPGFDGAHVLTFLSLKYHFRGLAETMIKAEPYGIVIMIVILMTPLKFPFFVWPVQMVLNLLLS